LHTINLSFDYYGGEHIVYKYIGDYNKNYIEDVEFTNATVPNEYMNGTEKANLVEHIKVVNGVVKDVVTIDWKFVSLDDPRVEVINEVYSAVARHQEEIAEAKQAAQQTPHLDSNISQ
jgi:hypothetical protein